MNVFKKLPAWLISLNCISCMGFSQQSSCQNYQSEIQNIPYGYNLNARIDVEKPINLFNEISFLYWYASQSNMELGVVADYSNPNYFYNGKIIHQDFNYDPGFKLTLGGNLNPDKWDCILQYTWFKSTSTSCTSLIPYGDKVIFPSWQLPDFLISYYYGSEQWQLNMNILDLNLGKTYFVSDRLSFRSFYGARATFINEKVNISYRNVTNPNFLPIYQVNVEQKSNSWAVGPRIGLDTSWILGYGLNFYGNTGLDISFTQYPTISFKQETLDTLGQVIKGSLAKVVENNDNQVRLHTDLEFGISWGTHFYKNKFHTQLKAGYTFQVFFDQDMFRSFVDDQTLGKADSPHGNLYIHGLDLSWGINY